MKTRAGGALDLMTPSPLRYRSSLWRGVFDKDEDEDEDESFERLIVATAATKARQADFAAAKAAEAAEAKQAELTAAEETLVYFTEDEHVTVPYQVWILSFWIKKATIICGELKSYDINGLEPFSLRRVFKEHQEEDSKYALERRLPAYRVSVTATPFYEKLAVTRRYPQSIDDISNWDLIEGQLDEFFKVNKHELKVEMLLHWAPTSTGDAIAAAPSLQSIAVALPITGSGTEAGVSSLSSGIVSRNNSTNRQLAVLKESNATDPEAASTQEILERWECHKRTCDNNGQYCWVNEKGMHYPLSADDATLWWGSIKLNVSKQLDKEKPPATMRKRWEEARIKGERKKRRQQKDEAISFGPPPSASYPGWGQPPATYVLPPPVQPMVPPPLSSIRTSQLEAELQVRKTLKRRESVFYRQPSRSRSSTIFATSPPHSGSSPFDGDVAEYIEWIKPKLHPRDKDNLKDAKNKLLDQDYTTRDVQGWKVILSNINGRSWEFCLKLAVHSLVLSANLGVKRSKTKLKVSLYSKFWSQFRGLANLAGETHKFASNSMQIEQIFRYYFHILKIFSGFIFKVIQILVLYERIFK